MDVNTSMLYTIGGYAALIGLGLAVYNVSVQKSQKRGSVTQTKAQRPSQPEPRKEEKKKKQQRMESFATESQEAKQAAAKVVDQVKSIVDPTPRAQGKDLPSSSRVRFTTAFRIPTFITSHLLSPSHCLFPSLFYHFIPSTSPHPIVPGPSSFIARLQLKPAFSIRLARQLTSCIIIP
jgi:hypothetical protein